MSLEGVRKNPEDPYGRGIEARGNVRIEDVERRPSPLVVAIFISPDKGQPMVEWDFISAIPRLGLEGDRYALNQGAYSHTKPPKIRHVTLIDINAIEEANRRFGTHFTPADTRRNIITRGVNLDNLLDKEFSVGSVFMRGTELCTPCMRPSILLGNAEGKTDFLHIFDGRGGIRAEVLTHGTIFTGSGIIVPRSR